MVIPTLRKASAVYLAAAIGFAVPARIAPEFGLSAPLVTPCEPNAPLPHTVLELSDFREHELRGAGITLNKGITLHVSALGGGDKSFWRDIFDDDSRPQMYAAGWIINAETREPVWEMTYENTSGRSDRRKFDDDVTLSRGSYEVYFAAHGYEEGNAFSRSSMNIDRRRLGRSERRSGGRFFKIFDGFNEDKYGDFMEHAKDWGLTLTVSDADASALTQFEPPAQKQSPVLAALKLGDGVVVKKSLSVTRDIPIHISAIGEGRRRDGMFDYGWIVRSDTRERVWEMTLSNTRYAGGDSKNRKFDGDVNLIRGNYELYYITDGSHSNDDWNAKPPYDPYNYGIAITVKDDAQRNSVKISDLSASEKNVIVQLTRAGDNDYVNAGFSLKADTKLRVYALGERDSDRDLADYGWIANAKTRDRVWEMDPHRTYHAGGDQKNRMVDEVITLPKGTYIAYYQTDGSHAYNHWNSDPPFDEEHWGLTIMGVGEKFDAKSVSSFREEEEKDVVAQIIRVSDDKHLTRPFTIDRPTKVRIYALGEGQNREMFDYGWIEEAKTGRTVWEMTYNMTDGAGGAKKNRMVSATILLDGGEYVLHYETDGSHSFNDWNADPPEDRTHWGITLYKEQ